MIPSIPFCTDPLKRPCSYYVFSKVLKYSYLGNPDIKKGNKKIIIRNNSWKNKILFFIRTISFIFGFFIEKVKYQ